MMGLYIAWINPLILVIGFEQKPRPLSRYRIYTHHGLIVILVESSLVRTLKYRRTA